MDRRDKALHFVDLRGRGLEIGPSYNPLVTKASGANVETVDHADRDQLVAKYRALGLAEELLERIEPVDHIWSGGSLAAALPSGRRFDYIVASHFIEHTVDLIQFLRDCESVLVESGRLTLVVPDKRYCFDRFQPVTSLGAIVDAHHNVLTFHPPGTLLDHQAYACKRGESIAWDPRDTSPLSLQFPNLEGATEAIEKGLRQAQYEDMHRWKFTPSSFALLVHDLRTLGYHGLTRVGGFDTEGFEFFVTLGPLVSPASEAPVDRAALLFEIERELTEVAQPATDADGVREPTGWEMERAALLATIDELRSSTSWRVTRPLRALSDVVRRRRERGG
jgi:hypothetical protein